MWNLRPKTLKSAKKMNFLKQIGDDDNRREVNKLKKIIANTKHTHKVQYEC